MPSWLSKLGKHERERTEGTRSPSPGHSSSGSRSRALSSASTRSSGGNHPRAKSEGSASAREAFEELGVLNLKNSKKLPPREPTPEPPRVEVDFVSQDDASSGLDVTVVPPSPAGPGSDDASLPPDNDDNNSEKEGSGEGKRFNVPPDILTDGGAEEAEEILTAKPASLHSKPSQPKMRRQISETSINTNVPIITTNAGHGRYATTGSTFTGSPTDGNIVESPTGDIPPNHEQIPSDNTITSANASPPQPKPTKKGSSWRPSSKQRKPTGLAAAIAGSSLAMVNATGGSVITMPPVPNSAPTGSTKSKDAKPPVPPLPHGITTDASSNSQAKRASMSAGALPMSSHSHHKSSSAESSKKSSAKRERVVSNPSSINDKRKNSQKRRAATEYTPGGELHVPPVPSVRGASASTPGFQRSTTLSPDAVHHRTSNSNLSTNGSQSKRASGYFSGTDAGEHSAASSVGEWSSDEDQSDETSSEESDDNHRSLLADLDLADGEGNGGAVTGFAVASSQRNQDFHKIFPSVPEGDYLIDDYGCALQRDILIQGRLYVSENHVCFHANIFGWITDLSVPIFEITSLERKMTAFVIPNAIQITTRRAKYTFASFLARDTTFDVIYNVWRSARTVGSPDGESIISGEGAVQAGGDPGAMANGPTANGSVPARKATRCACGERGEHYTEKAMEIIIPGTPERIYNLMFASGFMKDFLRVDQKLIDLQMADWTPVAPGSKLLTRNMSYIKPLNGSVGPKQTKCEISDEVVHCDFDTYVSTITTTRTPDVPSGGVFSVKTRTCIMWASAASTKVIVTTQVEWTGRSFIKGIIERSCIEGQKTYHNELDKAMRAYIQQHQSEFIPEGIDPALAEPTATTADAAPLTPLSPTSPEGKQREKERNERAKQWAYDTFAGAARVAKDSTSGALDLIADAWDQSSSTTILWFVIVILVFSNLATLFGGQKHLRDVRTVEESLGVAPGRPGPVVGGGVANSHLPPTYVVPPVQPGGNQDWVKGVVREIWEEMRAIQPGLEIPPLPPTSSSPPTAPENALTIESLAEQVREMRLALEMLESKVLDIALSTSPSSPLPVRVDGVGANGSAEL